MAADVVVGPVVEKVVDSLYVAAKKKIGYMWNCKKKVAKLENEVNSLKVMKEQVQQQIAIADDKGDKLLSGVEEWLNKAGNEITEAEVFLGEFRTAKTTCCFQIGICSNWATLYYYGKGATEMMTPLTEHKASGTYFVTCVSVETLPPTQLDVYQTRNPENLGTHDSAMNDIIAALKDESNQIIGIYGSGGVGKTTLAMEVAAKVKKTKLVLTANNVASTSASQTVTAETVENDLQNARVDKTNMLFADVVITTVSQRVNPEKIQKDLENARKRIMKGDKILIILDDVWEKLDLNKLCIPCGDGYKNCKILLTSRSEKVCQKMKAQKNIYVNVLPPGEAWSFFKHVVGEKVEIEAELKPIALKIVEKCGGLPLLIQAVGNTLKNETCSKVPNRSWGTALTQLQKHAASEIDPDIWQAFISLKLSYDYLRSEDAKSCFLLCSLFPEDEDIKLENLVLYGVGLGKFDKLDNIQDARDRVQNAVNILTSSGLLLNVKDDEYFTKMHDVVRDVALLIASEGENKFSVDGGRDLTKWLPRNNNLESSMGISLMFTKNPGYEVHQPRLDIVCINKNSTLPTSSDEFIRDIEVKVLEMACNGVSSLQPFTKLRMLNLQGNKAFNEISILGEMEDLEILILNDTRIRAIPPKIGQLAKLRRLEVNSCEDLVHITPGVISELLGLEELFIDFRYVGEGVHDCLVEIMTLSKLTYLSLLLPYYDGVPEHFNFERLKGFVIQIGSYYPAFCCPTTSTRFLVIDDLEISFFKWTKKMMEVCRPNTILRRTKNLKNIMPTLYDEGFNTLEHMELKNCPLLSCLVDDTPSCYQDQDNAAKEVFLKKLKHLNLYSLYYLEVLWKCPDE